MENVLILIPARYQSSRLPGKPMHHRQAKTAALADVLGRKEWLEGAILDFGGHARAGIADRKHDIIAVPG